MSSCWVTSLTHTDTFIAAHCLDLQPPRIPSSHQRKNIVYWNPDGRSIMISCSIKSYKRQLREWLYEWYAFFAFWWPRELWHILYMSQYIHGEDLLDSSVDNLHLACYTESLVAVLFLLPHKYRCDLSTEYPWSCKYLCGIKHTANGQPFHMLLLPLGKEHGNPKTLNTCGGGCSEAPTLACRFCRFGVPFSLGHASILICFCI